MKQILLLSLAASLFLAMAFITHKDIGKPHRPSDTNVHFISTNMIALPQITVFDTLPKYRYFFTLPNTDGYLRSEDSVKMVLQNLGKTLSVDQAEEYRKFAFRHLFLMERYHVMDSVLLETKPVVKKGGK